MKRLASLRAYFEEVASLPVKGLDGVHRAMRAAEKFCKNRPFFSYVSNSKILVFLVSRVEVPHVASS